MRIEILDCAGRPHTIDSSDTDIISKWLLEAMMVIKPSTVFPASIRIWPDINEKGESDWSGQSIWMSHRIVNVETLIDVLKEAANNIVPKEIR